MTIIPFILWITLLTANGPELSSQEYSNKAACENAAKMYTDVNESRFGFRVTTVCTPKEV